MADLNYLVNFDSDTKGLDTARKGIDALTTALGALGIGFGLKELAEVADAYNTLSARIAVAVGETGNVQEAMAGVQKVALETTSSLEATSQLFSKIHDVGKSMGLTQQQSLDLTKTINQAISLSGGSAQSAEASITQLSQALASGVLRGDEFNSINEQAPEIMKALANSLQVTTGELRKMAEEGKLSSQVVINALQNQASTIEEKYAKFPMTIGQAMQNIKTQWQIVVGEFNAESGASAVVVKALQTIGDNLAWLKNVFDDVGSGVAWFSDRLSQIDDSTIDELKTTLSLAYDTVKDLAKSIGDMGETAWRAFKSVLDSVSPVFSAFVNGEQSVSGLDTALRALQLGMGVLSDGAKGLSIVLNGLVGGLQFVAGGLSAVQAKVADFLGFDEVAKQAQMASDRLFALGEQSLSRANELALNFKSKTVQAIDEINKTEQQKNAESVASHKQALADKTQAWQEFVLKERNFFAERQMIEERLKLARQVSDDEQVKHYLTKLSELDTAEQTSTKNRQKLEKEKTEATLAYAEQAIKANHGVIDEQLKAELHAKGFAVAMSDVGKVSVTALSQVAENSEKAGLSLKDMALNAVKGLGVDVKQALNEINPAFQANIEQVKQVADGYNELKEAGMDAGALIKASLDKLLEGAKSQKEIDTVRQMFVQFGTDGKLSTSQVESGLEAINEKLDKTPELLDDTARAFKELGIISQAEAEKQAKKQIEMFELVKNSGQASSEQLQQALSKVQKSIETSGNLSQQSWLSGQQHAMGLTEKVEQQSKALDDNSQKTAQNTQSKIEHTTASKNQAQATEKATQAEQEHAQALQVTAGKYSVATANMRQQIISLQQYGATAEQINKITATMYQSIAGSHADFNAMNQAIANVNAGLQQQVTAFKNAKDTAENMTQALSGANVSSQDLALAQIALNKATTASVNGIARMDNQTLSNLQNAIDNARAKVEQTKVAMLDLTKQAKGMVDNLTGELARLKGDDTVALKIEHNKKLADIEQKIAEARKRNNADEVAHLQRALELQRQINAEQSRQATERKKKEQAEKIKQSQSQANTANEKLDTSDIKQSFSELMAKAKKDGKQELLKELADDMKRLAR